MMTGLAYAMGANPQAGQGQGGGLMGFLPLVIIFVIFYFLLIRPQQKKAKEQKAMLDNLKKGDKVIISGGEYGVSGRGEGQYGCREDCREREGQVRQGVHCCAETIRG